MDDPNFLSRRRFVTGSAAAAGAILLGKSGTAATSKTSMDINALKKTCKGVVAVSGDSDFEKLVHCDLWNRRIPGRGPQIIVRASGEDDVIAAIHFARANKLKVVVRGGGHNWCQPTLRNGGLLIDLGDLNKVISIDAEGRKAVVQPVISNREVQKALNAKGLAFPSGHCPEVKLSGYLLGGGMSWNQTVWGTGMESVEAIELVTAAGELITASATENSEYFWAARGAGSGFFGVVTRYHLKLHPLPGAIHGSTYYFSLDDAPAVAKWLGEIADSLSPAVELSIFLLEAPANLRKKVADHAGKICMVTAAAFADTEQEAKSCLQPLENGPLAAKCLSGEFATPLDFEKLFDASGALWPSGLRNRVEAMFFNAAPEDLVEAVHTHVAKSPSQITLTLFVIYAGPAVPAPLPDTAFSMSAKIYAGPWTMWKDEADDDANTAWHNECVKLLQPHIYGHYVGESDTVTYPAHAVGCFSSANWHRLADLRDKYDPDGVFFGYFDGLNSETP